MDENKTGKRKRISARYQPGFLARLDGRLEVARILNSAFVEVTDDMGGLESLSHAQTTLAERFVFLEYVLRRLENRIATEPKKGAVLLSRWIQGLNSLTGLARTIGLERRARKTKSLESYIVEAKNGNRKRA